MKCSRIQPLLSRLIDSDLNRIQRVQVRLHLRQCQACTAELAAIQAVSDRVRTAVQSTDARFDQEDIWAAIQFRLPDESNPSPANPEAVGLDGLPQARGHKQKRDWLARGNRGSQVVPFEWKKCFPVPVTQLNWRTWSPVMIGFATVLIFSLWLKPERQVPEPSLRAKSAIYEVPVVEEVFQEGVTVMTFETRDPKIKVVWFFKENSENENGGVS